MSPSWTTMQTWRKTLNQKANRSLLVAQRNNILYTTQPYWQFYCNTSVYLPFAMIFAFLHLPAFLLAFPSAFRFFICLLARSPSFLSLSSLFLRLLLSLQPSRYSQVCRTIQINTVTMLSAFSLTCAAGT